MMLISESSPQPKIFTVTSTSSLYRMESKSATSAEQTPKIVQLIIIIAEKFAVESYEPTGIDSWGVTTFDPIFDSSGSGTYEFWMDLEEEEEEVVELRMLDPVEARHMILNYIKTNPRCLTGDIIMDLELDPDLVLDVLHKLEDEGIIRGREAHGEGA